MAYTAPTYASFIAHFPAFAAVSQPVIEYAIERSARRVDTSWLEGDYTGARELYTAHLLAMDGYGTSADAMLSALAGFSSISSGSASVTRASGADLLGNDNSLLSGTRYGRQFLELLALNKAGPRVLNATA